MARWLCMNCGKSNGHYRQHCHYCGHWRKPEPRMDELSEEERLKKINRVLNEEWTKINWGEFGK